LGEDWIKVEKRASIVVVAPRLDSALTPRSTRLMYLMAVMCHEVCHGGVADAGG
jgi:hypothetical protein